MAIVFLSIGAAVAWYYGGRFGEAVVVGLAFCVLWKACLALEADIRIAAEAIVGEVKAAARGVASVAPERSSGEFLE